MKPNDLKRNAASIDKLKDERKDLLRQLIADAGHQLAALPQGDLRLRVTQKEGRNYYYIRKTSREKTGTYVRRSDIKSAKDLAEREYLKRVIMEAEGELASLENLNLSRVDGVYSLIKPGIRELITPICLTDEQYTLAWKKKKYEGLSFEGVTSQFHTLGGERVRSKSELMIANALFQNGIPYKYECPVNIPGLGTIYPDFTCLNVRLRIIYYLEHFGMMDDPEYAARAKNKIFHYAKNEFRTGIKLIFLTESLSDPLDTRDIDLLIRRYLK